MREEGPRRPEKLSDIHEKIILKLIADSPFYTSNRIALKRKNNYEGEVHRGTIYRFLNEKDYEWRRPYFFKNNEKDQKNKLKFCIKVNERDWSDVLIRDEVSFYLLSLSKHR